MNHRYIGDLTTDGTILFKGKDKSKQIGQVFVQETGIGKPDNEMKANAEHIVFCWNMHERLINQLKSMVVGGGTKDMLETLDLLEKCGVDYRKEIKERGVIL